MKNVLKILQQRCRELYEKDDNVLKITSFFSRLKEYWYLYDIDNCTIHEKVFDALYTSKKKSTYEEIANKFYIGERTLDRYILKYNRLALKLIEKEYSKNELLLKSQAK